MERAITKKHILFVVNPISGLSTKKIILKQIEKDIDRDRYTYEVVYTEYAGHATEIARNAANRGIDIVCAVGGDGTVNEIARALVHTETSLAIIPSGSGNGLARHLHVPVDTLRAIKVLNEGQLQSIDYGLVNLQPFFCTCGIGFDALISQKFAESGKRGPLTYIENVLQTVVKYNADNYEIELEDEHAEHFSFKALLIACANASQYGNNAYIAPHASVRDGLLDVMILEPFNVLEAPTMALQLMNGTIDRNSHIKMFRCRKLTIRRKNSGVIHYDGDPIDMGEVIEVSIIKGGLSCVCPKSEGLRNMGATLQNHVLEFYNTVFLHSEDVVLNTARHLTMKDRTS